MDSTGVYWIPMFELLEAHGFQVVLGNAGDVKAGFWTKDGRQRCAVASAIAAMARCAGAFA
jgi:transposase